MQPFVTPDDPLLFAVALAARLLFEMSSKKGAAAFADVWPRIDGIPYRGYPAGNGPPHMFWGLDLQDYEGYAIMTGDSRCNGLTKGYQFPPTSMLGPLACRRPLPRWPGPRPRKYSMPDPLHPDSWPDAPR
ncbi:MAG: hypothetical protein IPG93_10235 [Burkholderiales bacterium]|nr:hypothetical protein [Burkholderiales bacterium]